MSDIVTDKTLEESDIEYFKQNLYRSLGIPKHMLDDAIVVYHETRPPEGEDANEE